MCVFVRARPPVRASSAKLHRTCVVSVKPRMDASLPIPLSSSLQPVNKMSDHPNTDGSKRLHSYRAETKNIAYSFLLFFSFFLFFFSEDNCLHGKTQTAATSLHTLADFPNYGHRSQRCLSPAQNVTKLKVASVAGFARVARGEVLTRSHTTPRWR